MNFNNNLNLFYMKAQVQYGDMVGTAAADISDFANNDLQQVAINLGVDTKRFKIVGVALYGLDVSSISLICEDLSKSNEQSKHMVKLYVDLEDENKDVISDIFKRLAVVLYLRRDEEYPAIDQYEELNLQDFIE